ncbi:hypothetical protein MCAL160_0538 [Mycoplasmopsis californica HAZ160_1]|uniref:Lipoprotein n=2 Tax=Mycoplasmopsis californica TaxID=2113 RepID=A0AAT9F843_9BACT|nr:hypothetical protein MCAL160_0538 [Mycoplasmopsis californica HAZ160_1]BBG42713.1 hypothetical protein MCAL160E_0538 [Mycoplasmopsis californica]BBG43288.1 hypothetical protein MCAL160L_0538 [Mycoplasmopsis californica]
MHLDINVDNWKVKMKYKKVKILSTITTLASYATVACSKSNNDVGIDIKVSKKQNQKKTIKNNKIDQFNFSYDGINYLCLKEDNFHKKRLYYGSMVLDEKNSQIDKMIPKIKDYYIDNFEDFDFPTISEISLLIRSLKPTRFWTFSKYEPRPISPSEFNEIADKLLSFLDVKSIREYIATPDAKILKESAFRILNFDFLKKHLETYLHKSFELYCSYEASENLMKTQDNLIGGYQENNEKTCSIENWVPRSPKDKNSYHDKNLNKKIPSLLWKLQRTITSKSSFHEDNRDIFISKQFYEKSLKEDESLSLDLIDWIYLSDAKGLMIQSIQYKLLLNWLKFLCFITNSVQNEMQENLVSINDPRKTLAEHFVDNSNIISELEDAILNYLKLDYAMGLTFESENKNIFQLFSGFEYTKTTDFRDTYRWAWGIYHDVVQPIKYLMGQKWQKETNSKFIKTFSSKNIEFYNFIWASISSIDKIDKPYLLLEEAAELKLSNFINLYSEIFQWKFKH